MPAAVPSAAAGPHPQQFTLERDGGLSRICIKCKERRPVQKFPCLPDPRCETCIPPHVREMKELRKLERAKKEFAKVIDLAGGAPAEIPKQSQLLGEIYREWGGYAELAHDCVREIQIAMINKPGSPGTISAMLKLIKMNLDANKLDHQIDVDQMNDAQLKAQRQMQAFEILNEMVKDKALAKPLLRLLKDHGLELDEQVIEEFGASPETREQVLSLAADEEEQAARDAAMEDADGRS